ncbi:MAG: hypothetical protein DME22_04665, partial [Verrucomicrobia bacterium]
DRGDDPQQLTAVIQVELGRDVSKKPVTLLGQRAGRRKQLIPFETFKDALEPTYLTARKQRKQVFQTNGKALKKQLALAGDTKPASPPRSQCKNISGYKTLGNLFADASSRTSLREDKRKSLTVSDPFLTGLEANRSQSQIVLGKHFVSP